MRVGEEEPLPLDSCANRSSSDPDDDAARLSQLLSKTVRTTTDDGSVWAWVMLPLALLAAAAFAWRAKRRRAAAPKAAYPSAMPPPAPQPAMKPASSTRRGGRGGGRGDSGGDRRGGTVELIGPNAARSDE